MTREAEERQGRARAIVPDGVPSPRVVPFDAPWEWLAAGWRDLWQEPVLSLGYGAAFAIVAGLLLATLSLDGIPALFPTLAGGFLLIGPVCAVGLYEISRRLGRHEPIELGDVVGAGVEARGQLAFFGSFLMFLLVAWMWLAFLLLMLFLGTSGVPPPSEFMRTLLFTPKGLGLLVVGSICGGLLAVLVFAISALSVPMLLVRRMDAVSAARASVAAVVANPKTMALWAALIVVMMAAGFATFLVGLVIAFPLIGHATWHAYVAIYGE